MDFTGLLAAFLLFINGGDFTGAQDFANATGLEQNQVEQSVSQDEATGLYIDNRSNESATGAGANNNPTGSGN